ncbi:MAG TPA: RNHCP domain-containing protein [bacterium]|nr:RNHCP domain-containing protein [bacterium]
MTLPVKRFRVINDGFTCGHCGRDVPPTAGSTPRNHCPFCLWCMHVDINPGDRANRCRGMMRPIGIYTHSKKSYVILHQCTRCAERVKAKAILYDANAPDNFDIIIELSGKPINEARPVPPHMMGKRKA